MDHGRRARRATLKDVAAASGVSRSTVSFVLNDTPNQTISEATRARVLQAAHDLGYKPHAIAKALREGTSRIVVLQVDGGLTGYYARSYLRGLDEELTEHDHVLVVRHGPAAGPVLDTINPRAVLNLGEPYRGRRSLDADPDTDPGDEVAGVAGVALQLGHLAEHGHREIALALPSLPALTASASVTPPASGSAAPPVSWSAARSPSIASSSSVAPSPPDAPSPPVALPSSAAFSPESRLRFAQRVAADLGLPPLRSLTVPRPRADGAEAVRAFRERHPAVTAIAAHDDDVALRALTALHDLGLRVPADCAVIGFDDTEYGALATPALTTVHIDAEEHGRQAARAVLGLSPSPSRRPGGPVAARIIPRQTV
jgi:DNA-binding LacI/PurR family transcriptional regulator